MKNLEKGQWVEVVEDGKRVKGFVLSAMQGNAHIEILGSKYTPNTPYTCVSDVYSVHRVIPLKNTISKQDRVMLQHLAVETNDAEWFMQLNGMEVHT
jgi:hypothetical protein